MDLTQCLLAEDELSHTRSTMQNFAAGKQPVVFSSYDVYDPRWPAWHDKPKAAMLAHAAWW